MKSLTRTVFKVALISGLAALLFFGSDLIVAARLGVSEEADAFFVAVTISRVLFALCISIGGALVPVLVPGGRPAAEIESLYVTIFNIILLALLTVVALGELMAPALVAVTSPGLSEETAQQASMLLRITFPSGLFFGSAAILMGMLNARERFVHAALSSLARAAATLGGMALFYGYGAVGMSIGWVLGSLIQLVMTLGICRWQKVFQYRPHLDWHEPALSDAWKLARTAVWGQGAQQVVIILEQVIASFLPSGTISAFNYATRVVRSGGGLAVVIVARVSLPALVTKVNQDLLDDAHRLFVRNLQFAAYLVFPLTAVLMSLSLPLSTFLFQRGAVTTDQVAHVATLLSLTSVWLVFQLYYQFTLMYLFARRQTRSINLSYIILLGGFVIWAGLIGWYGAGRGLALLYPLSLLLSALYGLWALRIPQFYLIEMVSDMIRLAVAALVAGGSALAVATISFSMLEALPAVLRSSLTLGFGLLIAGIMWLGVTTLLRVPETLEGVRSARSWAYSRLVKDRVHNPDTSIDSED